MKLSDAFKQGYREYDRKFTLGYTSRKPMRPENKQVYTAGGSRKGELYYMAPCWKSTIYCYRVYIRKAE